MRLINLLFKLRRYLKAKTYLTKLNPFFKFSNKISIVTWYGGFGNNLIQIGNSLAYSKFFKKQLFIPNHGLLDSSKISMICSHNSIFSKKDTFFYNDFKDKNYKIFYESQINNIFKDEIFSLIDFYEDLNLKENELVIHLRPMTTVENKTFKYIDNKAYLQNPLNYYLKLIEKFEITTIVIDNILSNPLLPILSKYKNVKVQSSTITEDFNYLLNAKNLAMSTNSTFSITAALLSRNLEKLYFSSLNNNNWLLKLVDCNEKYEIKLNNYLLEDDEFDLKTLFFKILSEDVSTEINKVK
jgi:hypothetical protein